MFIFLEKIAMTARLMSTLTLLLATALSTSVHAEPVVKMSNDILVNADGMTLYTFDNDVANSGKSACNGPCATLWPPALVAADAQTEGELSIVIRDDGSKQWAYKGMPIYTYAEDKVAGDINGDNFKEVWHVIK
jgi:predicted lipoprotein with Yx(FWY)xxD motif